MSNVCYLHYDGVGRCSITSKLKILNKNYKGLGMTEKEKKQEETDGTIILFLYPLIFVTKIPRD